jgi:hypothetical protein
MHADRTNRVVLAFIGLVAVLLGTAGLLAAGGVFGETFAHRRLFDNQFARYFGDHGTWLWPAIAGGAFVIMLLALIWLLRLLFNSDRAGAIVIPSAHASHHARSHHHAEAEDAEVADHAGGRTSLAASALTQAVAAEIETYHGVTSARARVLGDPTAPTLAIDVKAHRRADIPALVHRIEREVIVNAREALERPGLGVKLDIAVTDRGAARTN